MNDDMDAVRGDSMDYVEYDPSDWRNVNKTYKVIAII
jgi:hypothetical protein